MPDHAEADRDYVRLVARCLWHPGLPPDLDLSDVVQRTLLKAHEKRHQFRGEAAEQRRGWLRAILRNELRQAVRAAPACAVSLEESSRRWEEALAGDQSSPSTQAVERERLEQLSRALARLAEDERTAVELKHLHGCSVAAIGRQMGRTELAVAGLLKRGMRKLRLHLGGGHEPAVASDDPGDGG